MESMAKTLPLKALSIACGTILKAPSLAEGVWGWVNSAFCEFSTLLSCKMLEFSCEFKFKFKEFFEFLSVCEFFNNPPPKSPSARDGDFLFGD